MNMPKSIQHANNEMSPTAISLFTCAGIGDVGFRSAGFRFLAFCEKDQQRAELAALNLPEAKPFIGDISTYTDEIIHLGSSVRMGGGDIFAILCTAPCQGMSKSGQGTLLRNIREGKRPHLDPRNRLILPALKIIAALKPKFAIFENVAEMRNTIILDDNGTPRKILELIQEYLGDKYIGDAYDVEFADYGVPQRRKRLITVYSLDPVASRRFRNGTAFIPPKTHSKAGGKGLKPWVSVSMALKGFPPLDSKSAKTARHPSLPFHRVPVLDEVKYHWIECTPPSRSAFDNQCVNPKCGYAGNKTHATSKNSQGINQSNKDTPLYCEKCGHLLPRPYTTNEDGSLKIMSGYTSAYKRMDPDLPCPALTRNLSYPCSDHKVHPFENRVLSLAEAFRVHSLDKYAYKWGPIIENNGDIKMCASDTLIRVVLGESIPPQFMEILGEHLKRLVDPTADLPKNAVQLTIN